MASGQLRAPDNEERGDALLSGAPGVFVDGGEPAGCRKTGLNFVPLCRDGVYWAAVWEVMVDRADRVARKSANQWIQNEDSVLLQRLWLVGCVAECLADGCRANLAWDPLQEARPAQLQRQPALVPARAAER